MTNYLTTLAFNNIKNTIGSSNMELNMNIIYDLENIYKRTE